MGAVVGGTLQGQPPKLQIPAVHQRSCKT